MSARSQRLWEAHLRLVEEVKDGFSTDQMAKKIKELDAALKKTGDKTLQNRRLRWKLVREMCSWGVAYACNLVEEREATR